MSLLQQLRKDNMLAMKNHDQLKKDVCGLLISAIALAQKEAGNVELTAAQELSYVQRELKQTHDTLASIPESRSDLIEQTKAKIAILESYLPKQLTKEELVKIVNDIMADKGLAKEKKSQGILIKEVMAKYQGSTDGKTVSSVVSEVLNS